MRITFPCTGCGRSLKARPEDAGRSRKCPVCTSRVACPRSAPRRSTADEGILEAELVDAEPIPARAVARAAPVAAARPTRNQILAEADDDPYAMADPVPVAEPKKSCPMCGESILASAVKCRFCGELLDAKLKKGNSKKKRKSSGGSDSSGPRDIGLGLLWLAIGIGLTVGSFAMSSNNEKGGRFVFFYGMILAGLFQFCRGFWSMLTSR